MARWRPAHGKPLVVVRWLDAEASQPTDAFFEEEVAAVHKTTPMETYGLLLQQDSAGVTLMDEYYTSDGKAVFRGRNFIPASQVVEVVQLLPPVKRVAPSAPQTTTPTH